MAGDVENDIEAFIQQQKQKLAQERQDLEQEEPVHERKTWDKPTTESKPALAEERQRVPTPETGLLIGRNSYEARRKKLQEDRRKEYNELLLKKSPPKGPRRLPTPNGRSLPVGGGQDSTVEKRKALQEERSKEYNKMISQSFKIKKPPPTPEGGGLPVGLYAERRKKLEEERMKEYNEFLEKKPQLNLGQDLTPKTSGKHVHFVPEDTSIKPQQEPVRDQNFPGRSDHRHLPLPAQERLDQLRDQYYTRPVHRDHDDQRNPDLYERPHLQDRPDHFRDQHYRRSDYDDHRSPDLYYERSAMPGRLDQLPDPHGRSVQHDQDDHRYSPNHYHERSPAHERLGLPPARDNGNDDKSLSTSQKGYQSSRSLKENLPPKPATPDTFLNKLGSHERQKKKLDEERKKEYNQLMAEKTRRGERAQNRPGETLAIPGQEDRSAVQSTPSWEMELFKEFLRQRYTIRKRRSPRRQDSHVDSKPYSQEKVKKRNEEYNEFLRQKERAKNTKNPPQEPKHENPEPRRPQPEYYGSIPGLAHSRSAEGRQRKRELNREYREVVRVMNMSDEESEEPDVKPYSRRREPEEDAGWLRDGPPNAPRTGWVTPTYEEILQKKQQEENRYRRYDDPELSRPKPKLDGRDTDGYRPEAGRTGHDKSLLDDDDWLKPQQMKNDLYNALNNMRDSLAKATDDTQSDGEAQQQAQVQYSPRRPRPERVDRPLATLMIDPKKVGHEETSSAKRRKKDAYRHDLEQQMLEHLEAKKWERNQDSRVNATGLVDPEKHPDRLRGLPLSQAAREEQFGGRGPTNADSERPPAYGPPVSHRAEYPRTANDINPYLNALDSLSSRTEALLERQGDGGRGGILDRGWEGLVDRPRHPIKTSAPPGYENSSYLSGAPDYGAVNEAYHLSGMRNPLEAYNDMPSASYDAVPGNTRVKFDEPVTSPRKPEGRRSVLPFPVEESAPGRTRQKQDTQSYQAELQKQIEEQRLKKRREKEEQERLDRKWEEENKNYNPFGRGGGGAPLKDAEGQTLANLRQLRINGQDDSPVKQSPRAPPQPVSPRFVAKSPPPNQQGESTYARGGHGIFGVPKTYEEKTASDRYKDDLRQQIEDKRRRELEAQEKQRQEEERENRILEEQQRKIQQEYDEEQRKKMEKAEEARRKNEELRQLTEEKKRQAEENRKEQEEKRLNELREREEEERRARERERLNAERQRPPSPPVPALKSKRAMDEDRPVGGAANISPLDVEQSWNSPVVPALRKNSAPAPPKAESAPDAMATESRPPRASSADVLNQLAAMRRQLQTERARVENALDRQRNDYEVYDPRLVAQRPPVVPRRDPEFDIFEGARNRAPVSVRRPPPDNANTSNIKEFNYLKNKGGTESRRGVRESFPDTPQTNSDLEAQQLALIQNQEDSIRNHAYKSVYERELPNMAPRDLGLVRKEPDTPQALLQSDSAFIDFNGMSNYPEDFDDLPRRNDSARQRRREKPTYSPRYAEDNYSLNSNPMGSDLSLNVDRISKKNEERLKRLKQMTGDDVSLADPDDVLDRFMARQRHNRPPSGQTLHDDTWMRPGSK